jgi:hypothetical protein
VTVPREGHESGGMDRRVDQAWRAGQPCLGEPACPGEPMCWAAPMWSGEPVWQAAPRWGCGWGVMGVGGGLRARWDVRRKELRGVAVGE